MNWSKPKYPGDTVCLCQLRKNGELGDVRIQWYGEASVRVGAFLPGRVIQNDGDTPKVEPNKDEWCATRDAANSFFELFISQALADGWIEKSWSCA